MSAWQLGLARWAEILDRDLQRAAREAGGGAALFGLGEPELKRRLRIDDARTLVAAREEILTERARLCAEGIHHVGIADVRYPPRLSRIPDAPFGLFGRGNSDALVGERPVVAIVGSRRATNAGVSLARTMARELAAEGVVIVSGLSAGIDAGAHEGALDRGGTTVSVMGSGVDVIYPHRHRDLAERIATSGGALVSEYWPGTSPAPWRFAARSRIIAGLCDALVVVEASERSGALIAADFAIEAGRCVLAVPGFPRSAASRGSNGLLRVGAEVCEEARDVLAALGM